MAGSSRPLLPTPGSETQVPGGNGWRTARLQRASAAEDANVDPLTGSAVSIQNPQVQRGAQGPPGPSAFAAAGLTPPSPQDPAEVGGYRIAGRIGAGGMGTVYGAVDELGLPVALKLVHRDYAEDPVFRARFAREVDLVRRVDCLSTPAFYAADTDAELPWLATEYIPGLPLRAHIERHGPLTGGTLLGFAAGVAEALVAIHDAGIVHRDLKPGNVILGPDGPSVLDFGIARAVEESAITRTGGLMGTPGWVAPERFANAEPLPASDLFAWGGLVAFAATGRAPFGRDRPHVLAARVLKAAPDIEGVPDELAGVVEAALDKNPDRRPDAAGALRAVIALRSTRPPASTREATSILPVLLEREWVTFRPAADPSTSWASLTPNRRRSRTRRKRPLYRRPVVVIPTALVCVPVLLLTGFFTFTNVEEWWTERERQQYMDRLSEEVSSGGPDLVGDPPERSPNAVGVNDSAGNGFEYNVAEEKLRLTEIPQPTSQVEADVRLSLDRVSKKGDGVRFDFTAYYHRDEEGNFVVHARDFAVITPRYGTDPRNPWANDEFARHAPDQDKVLSYVASTPSLGVHEFSVTFSDVPKAGVLSYGLDPDSIPNFPAEQEKYPTDRDADHVWTTMCYDTGRSVDEVNDDTPPGLPAWYNTCSNGGGNGNGG